MPNNPIHLQHLAKHSGLIGFALVACLLGLTSGIGPSTDARAATIDELQDKIAGKSEDIKALEKEIATYQKQIDSLGSEAQSLANTIKSLDLSRKKLEANIALTEDKITEKNIEISKLSLQIDDAEADISDDRRIMSQTFNALNKLHTKPVLTAILGNTSVAASLAGVDELSILKVAIVDRVGTIRKNEERISANKKTSENARAELVSLKKELADERQVVLNTTKEENDLLAATKKSEQSYKKLVADKKALKDAFEAEMISYESELHLLVDASLLPKVGSGVLAWPLSSVKITQYFGNTSFSTTNPQVYNGRGHTGIDLRASIGTPVKSAGEGVISGVGNTDIVRGCYSYGKWILIKHPNGLSTLYGHLSLQSVSAGQAVHSGDIIGYSGNTGYSTGPHLHFGVYATQGVKVQKFENSANCKGAVVPVADFKAYLNPLSYL